MAKRSCYFGAMYTTAGDAMPNPRSWSSLIDKWSYDGDRHCRARHSRAALALVNARFYRSFAGYRKSETNSHAATGGPCCRDARRGCHADRRKCGKALLRVAINNSESAEESGVIGFTDAISPACLSSCDRSSVGLDADSVVGQWWNSRTSPCVISCTFLAAGGRVGRACSRSTACSGSCSTDCGHAVWR